MHRLYSLLGLLVEIVGCATAATRPVAVAPLRRPADEALLADLADDRRHHRHDDALLLLTVTLDGLTVPPAQRLAVTQLEEGLLQKMRAAESGRRQLLDLLAEGVASSDMESQATERAMTKLADAIASARDASVAVLAQLHQTLAPADRAAVVDMVAAHPSWWAEANMNEADSLQDAANEVQLTDQQLATLGGAATFSDDPLGTPAPAHAADVRALDAFRTASFDASAIVRPADADIAIWKKLVHFSEVVNPILSETQRSHLFGELRRLAGVYEE